MADEMIKVSIIVPVHNSEETLCRCLDSILSQDYKNIECIIIENGSIDDSKNICASYSKQYTNVYYKSIESSGASKARNIGLEMTTGDVIGFCDADDFLEQNAISSVVPEFIENSNIIAVFGGFNEGILKNGSIVRQYRGLKNKKISVKHALQLNIINDFIMGSVWNKYYKKQALSDIRFDEELSLCEDMHFNARVLSNIDSKYSVKVISTPLYCYMVNPNSITHDRSLLFDTNNELKYIVALDRIGSDCNLDSKSKSYVKMKTCCFAIDSLVNENIDAIQREKLIGYLKDNYMYLIKYFYVNNWKWNIKRIIRVYLILKKKGR